MVTIPKEYAIVFKPYRGMTYVLASNRQKAKYLAAKEAVHHKRYKSIGEALKSIRAVYRCYENT